MTRNFTQRVGAFLAEEFGHIADSTLNRVSPASGERPGSRVSWQHFTGEEVVKSHGHSGNL